MLPKVLTTVLRKSCPDAFFRMGVVGGESAPEGQSFPAPAPDVTEAMTDEAGSAV